MRAAQLAKPEERTGVFVWLAGPSSAGVSGQRLEAAEFVPAEAEAAGATIARPPGETFWAEVFLDKHETVRWEVRGGTIVDPATTYIDVDVRIGRDTVVHPMTFMAGATRIGPASSAFSALTPATLPGRRR